MSINSPPTAKSVLDMFLPSLARRVTTFTVLERF
jgi:hypothetical protein